MKNIKWSDFKKLDLRIGTIGEAKEFNEAIKPAYQLKVNLVEYPVINELIILGEPAKKYLTEIKNK